MKVKPEAERKLRYLKKKYPVIWPYFDDGIGVYLIPLSVYNSSSAIQDAVFTLLSLEKSANLNWALEIGVSAEDGKSEVVVREVEPYC